MNQSETINELATALAKAQGEISAAHADSENPFFQSKYADLTSVWDACRAPLSKNGLAVTQTMNPVEQGISVVTTLFHSSGQWVRGELVMMPNKNDPQGVGSCITYNRRYSLSAMVGISPEDDDGNEASKGKAPNKTTTRKAESKAETSSQTKTNPGLTLIKSITQKTGKTQKGKDWTRYKITDANGNEYSTFSKTQADIAKIAKDKKAEVIITYKTEGQYKNIELIEMQDPEGESPK